MAERHFQGQITRKQFTSDQQETKGNLGKSGISFIEYPPERPQTPIEPKIVEMTNKIWIPPFEPYEKELVDYNRNRGGGITNMRQLNDYLIHLKTIGMGSSAIINNFLDLYVNGINALEPWSEFLSKNINNDGMIVYSGTISGLRISAVDGGLTESGGAFIDNAGATIPTYADGAHLIEIYDSSNQMIKGILKAQGDGEDLSETEINPDPGFDSTTGWTIQDGWGILGGKATMFSGTGHFLYRAAVQTALALYKTTLDIDAIANAWVGTLYRANGEHGTRHTTTGTKTEYHTLSSAASAAIGLYCAVPAYLTGTFDNLSRKQVTAPGTSGATIVSQKDGTTYNFTSKNASFTYNAASYYVVVRALR